MNKSAGRGENIFTRMHPIHRLLISAILVGITWLIFRNSGMHATVLAVLMWDVFALFSVISSWIVFKTRSTSHIRLLARIDDGSRVYVALVIIISSFASMLAVLLIVVSKDAATVNSGIYLPVAITGMLLAWTMVHTTFTFHYAHIYYDDNNEDATKLKGGLLFPGGEEKPDYLDFAYFSFVVGMTFQVSDVNITSKTMRRLVLLHGLLSFLLNTFVVALTINMIAGLKS